MDEEMLNIDWNTFKPLNGNARESFELLWYQIVSEKYKDEINDGAKLTPIDDSGGGDGVEFYLTFENGEVYGWQAKFFDRLSEKGREEQIKTSLRSAVLHHPDLTKWYLCTKGDFTTTEMNWFRDTLRTSILGGEPVVPLIHGVELNHWGSSKMTNFLREYPDIHKFFFFDKILTPKWFRDKFNIQTQKTSYHTKFNPELHIDAEADNILRCLIGGKNLVEMVKKLNTKKIIEDLSKYYLNRLEDVNSFMSIVDYAPILTEIINRTEVIWDKIKVGVDQLLHIYDPTERFQAQEFDYVMKTYKNNLDEIVNGLIACTERIADFSKNIDTRSDANSTLYKKDLEKVNNTVQIQDSNFDSEQEKLHDRIINKLFSLINLLWSNHSILKEPYTLFCYLFKNEVHFYGPAGKGKSHLVFNFYHTQFEINQSVAILILAKELTSTESLERQLLNKLGIPSDWAMDDFLGALNICACISKVRIPIMIDGLNEAVKWEEIWGNQLEEISIKIRKYPNLVLITTCRSNYIQKIFEDKYLELLRLKDTIGLIYEIKGFEKNTDAAITKYLEFYKIRLINSSKVVRFFSNPLFLKIYCETKNPERKKEVEVSFHNEDLIDLFDEYIKKCNVNITSAISGIDTKYNPKFTEDKLLVMAQYMWENNSRAVPRGVKIFNDIELSAFESENLLLYRELDTENRKESIYITYDLLAGYLIAKFILKRYWQQTISQSPKLFLEYILKIIFVYLLGLKNSKHLLTKYNRIFSANINQYLMWNIHKIEFSEKLLFQKSNHPLFEDILKSICILLIRQDTFLSNFYKDRRAVQFSTEALFDVNSHFIIKNQTTIKAFLAQEFKNYTVELLRLAKNTEFQINHPLNFGFWSELLDPMTMSERDLTWSEMIRQEYIAFEESGFADLVSKFERDCRDSGTPEASIHLKALKIMWILTSTIRKLRDEATRALYYYAQKFPTEFLILLEKSLRIDDPYVYERTLAVGYGVAMASRYDIHQDKSWGQFQMNLARLLYNKIFSTTAMFTTTHILARDSAKRTIDVALLNEPNFLTDEEKVLLNYPMERYKQLIWEELNPKKSKNDFDPEFVVRMDFKNYTIGRLVNGRSPYDFENNSYQKVHSQILMRIVNLGYSIDKFYSIDREITSKGYPNSRLSIPGKIDRYGKKYSWIAYFEMAGHRSDLSLLEMFTSVDSRISDIDIDPSFPSELRHYDIIEQIGDQSTASSFVCSEDWFNNDDDLNVSNLIRVSDGLGFGQIQDWLLLRGTISKRHEANEIRNSDIIVDCVLLGAEDYIRLKDFISGNPEYKFGHYDSPSLDYLFEGEFAWSDLVPNDNETRLLIESNTVKLGRQINMQQNFRRKRLNYLHHRSVSRSKSRKQPSINRYPLSIIIEHLTLQNDWESYHSDIIPQGGTQTPSKNICNELKLSIKPQSSDFYNITGELVSTSFKEGTDYDNNSKFTYIKKSYFDQYLQSENKKAIWLLRAQKDYGMKPKSEIDYYHYSKDKIVHKILFE